MLEYITNRNVDWCKPIGHDMFKNHMYKTCDTYHGESLKYYLGKVFDEYIASLHPVTYPPEGEIMTQYQRDRYLEKYGILFFPESRMKPIRPYTTEEIQWFRDQEDKMLFGDEWEKVTGNRKKC